MAKSKPHHRKKNLHSSLDAFHRRLAAKRPDVQPNAPRRVHKQPKRRPTVPFTPTDRILLLGEGNFSFTRALLRHPALRHLPPASITATSFDSEEICIQKYPDAVEILASLRESGVVLLFNVDATALERCSQLKNTSWDRIVWNFPHIGRNIADRDRNILANQELLLGFFRSASRFLTPGPAPVLHRKRASKNNSDDEEENGNAGPSDEPEEPAGPSRGTMLVTLRNVEPYTEWNLPKLAKNPPTSHSSNPKYHILRSFAFVRKEWPGYEHRMTKGYVEGLGTGGDRALQSGRANEERCWELFLAD